MLAVDKVTADITTSKCTCPAGQGPFGSCKHLAALCYALEDYVKMRAIVLEAGEESCTLPQKWNQPRKRRLDSKKLRIEIFPLCLMAKMLQQTFIINHDPRLLTMQKATKIE